MSIASVEIASVATFADGVRSRAAATALVDAGYLLAEDLERVVSQAGERYDALASEGG